ncbi:hypothetical protein [Ellagibacter isourolithinifaciens]|uniref:hypothetical protein n=1 Tax=Ellagibacter isourolithinifaciens TaxID=2137581 RepID=UPI003A8E7740
METAWRTTFSFTASSSCESPPTDRASEDAGNVSLPAIARMQANNATAAAERQRRREPEHGKLCQSRYPTRGRGKQVGEASRPPFVVSRKPARDARHKGHERAEELHVGVRAKRCVPRRARD